MRITSGWQRSCLFVAARRATAWTPVQINGVFELQLLEAAGLHGGALCRRVITTGSGWRGEPIQHPRAPSTSVPHQLCALYRNLVLQVGFCYHQLLQRRCLFLLRNSVTVHSKLESGKIYWFSKDIHWFFFYQNQTSVLNQWYDFYWESVDFSKFLVVSI